MSTNITCSFGVASYSKGDDRDTLLVRVDKALYEAKNSGRDVVCLEVKADALR